MINILRHIVDTKKQKTAENKKAVNMIDINKFVNLWVGKKCRDGQCVGLFREYTEGFLKTPTLERLGATAGAEGIFTRYDSDVGPVTRKVFMRIVYDGKMRPLPGDIVVFKPTEKNRFGHVGVYVEPADGGKMVIFDQDGIAAMEGMPVKARLSTWSMDRVLGWLRKREG